MRSGSLGKRNVFGNGFTLAAPSADEIYLNGELPLKPERFEETLEIFTELKHNHKL